MPKVETRDRPADGKSPLLCSQTNTAKVGNGKCSRSTGRPLKAPALSQILTAIWHRPIQLFFDPLSLTQSLHGLIEMAWYEVFVLWIWWCWERIRPFNSTRRNGRNGDDLTSLTDRMPVYEDKIIVSTVHEVASISLTLAEHLCQICQWRDRGICRPDPVSRYPRGLLC